MAYLSITRILGDADALAGGYLETEPVMTSVGRDHGLLLHAAAKAPDGLVVVNVWPSIDGSEAAARDARRAGVVRHHALTPDRFRREHFDTIGCVVF
jgi:hypothetical protein